ncbi:prepilin peptidase [Butyrivibrio sp. LC3010]|uniref:prepilin peptidase n=1 Tax=Butyrivibrio sp. LC3010 TaxID=1280680 RepID=UPI00047A251D|nr:A24 family peptidase [Butyrivibrio sp. LC3010]
MTTSILYCLVTGSAITDVYKNKIFNVWLLCGFVTGVSLSFFGAGNDQSILFLILRAAITFLLLLPVYLIKGIGGGDLKLLTSISIFLSTEEMISIVVIAFFIGAVFGLIKVIKKKNLHQTIHFALPILISTLLVTGKCILI